VPHAEKRMPRHAGRQAAGGDTREELAAHEFHSFTRAPKIVFFSVVSGNVSGALAEANSVRCSGDLHLSTGEGGTRHLSFAWFSW
jgi:hypothetical protein